MADQKITQLTADATPTSDDLIVTVNDPGGTPANRKVTVAQLATALAPLLGFDSRVGCGLYRSGARSFATGGESVPWDAEDFDTDGFHESVTNPSRITIPSGKAGLYLFTSGLGSSVAGTANKNWIQSIAKNGTTVKGSAINQLQSTSINPSSNVSIIVTAAVGDYFTTDLYQDAGVTKAMDLNQCSLVCVRLSA